jgi:hypothetical protein
MLFGPPCTSHYPSCQNHGNLRSKKKFNEKKEKKNCKRGETTLQQSAITLIGATTNATCA